MAGLLNVTTKKTMGGLLGGVRESFTQKVDLTTSQGLYQLATQSGFQKDADRILQTQKGEEPKKIFSGGFISDIFDTLNAMQYGVVGLLKGKSFLEGVQTRQSFSDKDALGEYGLPGVIGGIALDIASDPLTYIAPATIVKKIPGATKALKVGKESLKATKLGQYLGRKFVYRFGQDPVYKKIAEESIKNIGVGTQNLIEIARPLTKLDNITQKAIAEARKTGKLAELSPELLAKAQPAFDTLDDLGKQAVEVGLLPAETWAKNLGTYMPRLYKTKEVPLEAGKKFLGIFPRKPKRIDMSRFKARKDIPEEIREIMGEILEAGYPTAKGLVQLKSAVENVKFFNEVAKKFGIDVSQEGFSKLPETRRLFTTSTGEKIELYKKIKDLNIKLKDPLKALKQTFKADRETLSLIRNVENELGRLGILRQEEFYKFFQAGEKITKEIPERTIIKGAGKLPEHLRIIGEKVKPFKTFDDLIKSDVGIELEKLYQEGVLERSGFKDAIFIKGGKEIKTTGLKQFFNFIKKPYKFKPEKIIEKTAVEDIPKLIKLQKQIEQLSSKSKGLKEIDKRSIDDSYRFLEETINRIRGEKEQLYEKIGNVALGELSGKYVPTAIFDDIQEIIRSRTPLQQGLGKIVQGFKYGKVILNPATHARNIVSNLILNNFEGLNPARIDIYAEAGKELATKGKWYKEAVEQGLGLNTFAAQEIKQLLEPTTGMIGKLKGVADKLANIYQGEENFAKMAQYIFQRKAGKTAEEAWKIAERATFNYAQVTPFIRRLRESIFGYPFITFTYKVTPQVVKTMATKPTKISNIGKIKTAIENQADLKELERERASEPPWIRDGFYIKLPIKDKQGRSSYLDLSYIMPFGDLVSGQFFERRVERETGLPESQFTATIKKSPFINLITELGKNQDFYGDKIWQESDSTEKQLGDLMRHLSKTYLPPLIADQLPGGYKPTGERRMKGFVGALTPQEKENQQRTLMQEMLRQVGAKIQPIDADIQESMSDFNLKKALRTLLEEKGLLKRFEASYIPK